MRRRVARERPPQRKAVQKAPEGAPYLQPLLRCDGAGRILLRPSTKTECSTLAQAWKLCATHAAAPMSICLRLAVLCGAGGA